MNLYLIVVFLTISCSQSLQPQILEVSSYVELRSWQSSTLYQVKTEGSSYQWDPLLLYLEGSRYDMGFAYGYLLHEEISEVYHTLLKHMVGDKWYDEVFIDLIGTVFDWQWNNYLSKELPPQYTDELRGVADGSTKAGCNECGRYVTHSIVLSNLPSDLEDVLYILIREYNKSSQYLHMLEKQRDQFKPIHCSMFAVWGSRTKDSNLFSARNLDWNPDTGITKYKLIVVMKPNDDGIPSVSFTFACLYTTLAGMSANGITVHEANLEENEITFGGFPFVLRLRYIMEFASNTNEGRHLWESTNNTVGYNHMIASSHDAVDYANGNTDSIVAYAMETMYQYTAYFTDNDPREANATYSPPNSNVIIHIGSPMREALWRTNHGYDPLIRAHFEWSQAPSSWSSRRYMFIQEALHNYETLEHQIDYKEAINITAIVGDKGHTHPHECKNIPDGTNVLSVTYQPKDHIAYVAFESSTGIDWRPGVCSTYIKMDFTKWFAGIKPVN